MNWIACTVDGMAVDVDYIVCKHGEINMWDEILVETPTGYKVQTVSGYSLIKEKWNIHKAVANITLEKKDMERWEE